MRVFPWNCQRFQPSANVRIKISIHTPRSIGAIGANTTAKPFSIGFEQRFLVLSKHPIQNGFAESEQHKTFHKRRTPTMSIENQNEQILFEWIAIEHSNHSENGIFIIIWFETRFSLASTTQRELFWKYLQDATIISFAFRMKIESIRGEKQMNNVAQWMEKRSKPKTTKKLNVPLLSSKWNKKGRLASKPYERAFKCYCAYIILQTKQFAITSFPLSS